MDDEKTLIVFDATSVESADTPSGFRRTTRGDFTQKRERAPRKPRIVSDEKFAEMAKKYEDVCVHDYGDEYHMSEEERKTQNSYYEVFSKLIRCKRKYRKLDEFVRTFRLCLDCLRTVAANNGVYSPEKFIKLVLKGDIEVFGLTFPKYIGKDKKTINWEYISDFILGNEDPKELSDDKESIYEEMSDDEAYDALFTAEDRANIDRAIDEYVHSTDETIYPYYGDDEDADAVNNSGIVEISSKKETKRFIKSAPEIVRTIRDLEKSRRKLEALNSRLNDYAFDMTGSDYEKIARMDRERGISTESDVPEFEGDIMNRKDYKRYLYRLHQYELENIRVNYNGKMRTLEDVQELELKDALEKAGWNLRNLYRAKDKEKRLKKAYKADKKREEELKRRLVKIQDRQKSRKGKASVEFDAKGGKKKKKKNKKEED